MRTVGRFALDPLFAALFGCYCFGSMLTFAVMFQRKRGSC